MLKIRQTITFGIIYILFFSQTVFSQKFIRLPNIPVYSIDPLEFPNISPFSMTSNKKEAFLVLEITEGSTIRGAQKWVRNLSYVIGTYAGFRIGQSIGKSSVKRSDHTNYDYLGDGNFDEKSYNQTLKMFEGWGAYYGWVLSWALFNTGDINEKVKTTSYTVTLKTSGGDIVSEKKVKAKSDGKIVDIVNMEFLFFAATGWYPLSLFYIGMSSMQNKYSSFNLAVSVSFANASLDFINELYPNYSKLYSLVTKLSKSKVDYTDIMTLKSQKLASLKKLKGEFETTLQFQERLKKAELTRRTIEAKYNQKIAQRKADHEMKQLKKYREIEKMANEIEIERLYDFTLSNYDADRQQYTIYIPALNKRKNLVIPMQKARDFKAKSGNLVVKELVKPSLDGRWVPVYDDVVLTDAKTGKVIPWEGEVPTYAAAPVTNPPSLLVTVDLSEPSGEGYLDAEELANLKVTLTNNGNGPAKTTRISVSQESGPTLYYDVSATVNAIAPGKNHTERFQITVPENVSNGKVAFTVSFLEMQGFEPEPVKFTADVRAQREPILSLVDFGVKDQNGDGKVNKGESAEITARIQNKGQGVAKSVRVYINPQGNDVFMHPDSKKEFTLGKITAGEARDVKFTVLTNNRVGDMANIELKVDEKRPRFSKSEFIKLEIDKQQSLLAPLAFTGTSSNVTIADLATLTVEIEKDIPEGKKKNPDALAVVFGVEYYKNVSNVTFAKRDATYMKEYFEKVLGIPAKRIYYKTNDDVGKAEFDKVFSKDGWLDKRVKDNKTDLYIYYAGHGAPDIKENKAYLIPYDGDPNYASQTGYEMDELYEQLGNLGARSTTVFLDACFTGANRESEILLAGARPVFMEVDATAAGNVTVFSAAGGKEISSAWPEKKHGLFSYYLMKGMRGDADANKDKQITVGELGDYVKDNVSDMAGMLDREQTPGLQTLDRGKVLINF